MRADKSGWSVKRIPDKAFRPGEKAALTYVLRVGESGLDQGGCVFMTNYPGPWGQGDAALFATRNQMESPRRANYITAASRSGGVVAVGYDKGWFLFKNVKKRIPPGSTVKILLGHGPKGGRGRLIFSLHPRYEKLFERFVIDPSGSGKRFTLKIPTVNIIADAPKHAFARSRTQATVGERVPLTIEITDKYGNLVSDFSGIVTLTMGGRSRDLKVSPRNKGYKVATLTPKTPGLYKPRIKVVSKDGQTRLNAVSNPLVVTAAPPTEQVFWGEIHVHSRVSTDGIYSPDFCCRYARDVARLDFFALSDHSECVPFDLAPNAFSWPPPSRAHDLPVPEVLQAPVRAAIEEYHNPGSFVTFCGYEYDCRKTGQVNVYHPDDDAAFICGRNMHEGRPPDTPVKLCARLKGSNAIVIPHHVSYDRPNMGFAWKYFVPEWMPVVEIYSARHGSSEFFGCPRGLGPFDPERSIQHQLALGRRFGFIAGTDSHIGMAARRINRCGGPHQRGPERIKNNSGGLAAVFAGELSREAILSALRERRCYAVSGDRVLFRFNLAEHPMGTILPIRHATAFQSHRTFTVDIDASRKIQNVELICNNRVICSVIPNRDSARLNLEDRRPLNRVLRKTKFSGMQVYYYCRVSLEGGEMAWSSPIWLGEKT